VCSEDGFDEEVEGAGTCSPITCQTRSGIVPRGWLLGEEGLFKAKTVNEEQCEAR
jgi:hypothetical protein